MDYICKTYEEYLMNNEKANEKDLLILFPEVWKRILKNPDDLVCGECSHFKHVFD